MPHPIPRQFTFVCLMNVARALARSARQWPISIRFDASKDAFSGELALDRLTGFEQRAAGDLETAVALLLQRIERFPGLAVGVDDVHALRDPVSFRPRLTELEALVAVHRCVGVLHHIHEDLGTGE